MPLDRRVCECYLRSECFHTTSKFPPDAQKWTIPCLQPPDLIAAFCLSLMQSEISALREYNSWNNIQEMHRRRQSSICCTDPNNQCVAAVAVAIIVATHAFAIAKFLISKQKWFDIQIAAAKPGLNFRLIHDLRLAMPVHGTMMSTLIIVYNVCVCVDKFI